MRKGDRALSILSLTDVDTDETGIATAQELEDADALGFAQLRDQLALLQYVRGDLKRAETSARASLKLAEDSFSQEAPIAAMCQLRLGTILIGVLHAVLPACMQCKFNLRQFSGKGLSLQGSQGALPYGCSISYTRLSQLLIMHGASKHDWR